MDGARKLSGYIDSFSKNDKPVRAVVRLEGVSIGSCLCSRGSHLLCCRCHSDQNREGLGFRKHVAKGVDGIARPGNIEMIEPEAYAWLFLTYVDRPVQ